MNRILLVTPTLPWPLQRNGGSQRTALLLRALRAWGEVHTLGDVGPRSFWGVTPPTAEALAAQGVTLRPVAPAKPPTPGPWWRLIPKPLRGMTDLLDQSRRKYRPDPDSVRWLAGHVADNGYSLIVARYLSGPVQAGVAAVARSSGIPAILDFDDIDWLALQNRIEQNPWPGAKGKLGAAMVLRQVRRDCLAILPAFAHVWVPSDEDAAELPSRPSRSVLPNIPYADAAEPIRPCPPAGDGREVLFVGDLRHPPNHDGLERFLAKVWPNVRAAEPTAMLRVVGRGLTPPLAERWGRTAGVEVVGYVEDLRDAYARSAFTVAPVYWGAGTKIKVVESAAYGRACVTTAHAARGFGPLADPSGPSVIGTPDDAAFAAACAALLRDPARRDRMGRAGAAAAATEFSFGRFQAVVDAAVSRALPRPASSNLPTSPPVGQKLPTPCPA